MGRGSSVGKPPSRPTRMGTGLLMIPRSSEGIRASSLRRPATGVQSGPRTPVSWASAGAGIVILQEETADLATPGGPMRTYVYRPVAPGRYPGLLLFSEIFQRTGPIKRVAALLAGHGFVVAVPEIFHELEPPGTELAYDPA